MFRSEWARAVPTPPRIDELRAEAFELSRRARSIIRQNITISLGVICLLLISALAEKINLTTGVIGHEGSTVVVILTPDYSKMKDQARELWGLGDYPKIADLHPRRRTVARRLRGVRRPGGARRGGGGRELRAGVRERGRRGGGQRHRPGDGRAGAHARRPTRATTSSGWWPMRRSFPSRTPASIAWGRCSATMFAPRPEVWPAELFRVVRPGNTVGLTAWTPDSFRWSCSAWQALRAALPAGMPTQRQWGEEDTVRERLDGLAAR